MGAAGGGACGGGAVRVGGGGEVGEQIRGRVRGQLGRVMELVNPRPTATPHPSPLTPHPSPLTPHPSTYALLTLTEGCYTPLQAAPS